MKTATKSRTSRITVARYRAASGVMGMVGGVGDETDFMGSTTTDSEEEEMTKQMNVRLLFMRQQLMNDMLKLEMDNGDLLRRVEEHLIGDLSSMADKIDLPGLDGVARAKSSDASSSSMVAMSPSSPKLSTTESGTVTTELSSGGAGLDRKRKDEFDKIEITMLSILIRYLCVANAQRRQQLKQLFSQQSSLFFKAQGLSAPSVQQLVSALNSPYALSEFVCKEDRPTLQLFDQLYSRFPDPIAISETYESLQKFKAKITAGVKKPVSPRVKVTSLSGLDSPRASPSASSSSGIAKSMGAIPMKSGGPSSLVVSGSGTSTRGVARTLDHSGSGGGSGKKKKKSGGLFGGWKKKMSSLTDTRLASKSTAMPSPVSSADKYADQMSGGGRRQRAPSLFNTVGRLRAPTVASVRKEGGIIGGKLVRFDRDAKRLASQRIRCDMGAVLSALHSTKDIFYSLKQSMGEVSTDPLSTECNFGFDPALSLQCGSKLYYNGFDNDYQRLQSELKQFIGVKNRNALRTYQRELEEYNMEQQQISYEATMSVSGSPTDEDGGGLGFGGWVRSQTNRSNISTKTTTDDDTKSEAASAAYATDAKGLLSPTATLHAAGLLSSTTIGTMTTATATTTSSTPVGSSSIHHGHISGSASSVSVLSTEAKKKPIEPKPEMVWFTLADIVEAITETSNAKSAASVTGAKLAGESKKYGMMMMMSPSHAGGGHHHHGDPDDQLTDAKISAFTSNPAAQISFQTVCLTHRSFCDSDDFLGLLEERFFMPYPPMLTPGEMKAFKNDYLRQVRIKVVAVLSYWMKELWADDFGLDPHLTRQLSDFITRIKLNPDTHSLSLTLERLLEKKEREFAIELDLYKKRRSSAWAGSSLLTRTVSSESSHHHHSHSHHPHSSTKKRKPKALNMLVELQTVDILQFAVEKTGACLTHIAVQSFTEITPREILRSVKSDGNAPHVQAMVEQFNNISNWVQREILSPKRDGRQRLAVLKYFINLASHLCKTGDFSSSFGVISGFQANALYRLKQTKDNLDPATKEEFADLQQLFALTGGQIRLRKQQKAFLAKGAVPHVGLFKKDLIGLAETPSTKDKGKLINYRKAYQLGKQIENMKMYQNARWDLEIDHMLMGYIEGQLDEKHEDEDSLYRKSKKIE